MKITPYGASGGEVTGSAYLVETSHARVLVDCGLFQGGKAADVFNRSEESLPSGKLDAVLITHAHLDHVGRLPLLLPLGFTGVVWATPATVRLAALVLRDSARVQISDVDRRNRRLERAGRPSIQPLYSVEDVEKILTAFRPAPYGVPMEVAPGIRVVWSEAGHMLGSASLQLQVDEGGVTRRVVFSGDLGPVHAPILKEFEPYSEADAVFLESTYGDRDHRSFEETVKELVSIVQEASRDQGKILVPTFAIGRAQVLTMLLAWMFRTGKVKPFPIFLDSPMAIEAGKILEEFPELYDDDMKEFVRSGNIHADLRSMRVTASVQESMAINDVSGPCLVLAGAGMCNGGRILHHLRHNLWKPQTHVVMVGYQSADSLGRRLIDRAREVRIFGEPVRVEAKIHTLGGFSAHAGQKDLLCWFNAMSHQKPRVFLTHGEDRARVALAQKIQELHGLTACLPRLRETLEL